MWRTKQEKGYFFAKKVNETERMGGMGKWRHGDRETRRQERLLFYFKSHTTFKCPSGMVTRMDCPTVEISTLTFCLPAY